MSRLSLINKNLQRQYTSDKYSIMIKKLKCILKKTQEIMILEDEAKQEKKFKMLKGLINSSNELTDRQKKALLGSSIQNYKFIIMLMFQKLPRNAFLNRVRKRCIFSGRPRGLKNQISNMFVRRSARDLTLYGYSKI